MSAGPVTRKDRRPRYAAKDLGATRRSRVAAFALGATACGSSSSGGSNPSSSPTASAATIQGNAQGTGNGFPAKTPLNPYSAKGGTLNVGSAGDVDYLDPARTYYAFS